MLLEAGADANVEDSAGRTPVFSAVEQGHQHIVHILSQHGADLNYQVQCTDSVSIKLTYTIHNIKINYA